jgi:cerevisin
MRTTFAISSLLAICATALAAASPQDGFIGLNSSNSVMEHGLEEKEFIIMFEKDEHPDYEELMVRAGMKLSKNATMKKWSNELFVGMAVHTNGHCLDAFKAMPEVAYVEEKAVIKSFVEQKAGAPWGLQRISNEAGASGSPQSQDFTYSFEDASLGAGVDIYVLDTGVRTTHAVFTGRGSQGFTATGSAVDGDGHGTHCAGTAAGAKFGVAQGANIIAVKVLGDDGSGSSSDTISGIDFVINNHNKRKADPNFVGSIMSMSWGLQGTARAVDDVIVSASEAGIHVSVAAGNDGADACGSTPAQLGGANSNVVTVGSVNIQNGVSTFSNVGKCVDIFAPGEQILSSWSTGDNIINFLSGTSMACPHTTGAMAALMAQDKAGLGQNPAALKKKLLETARKDIIVGSTSGSPNLLLSNGVDGGVPTAAQRLLKKFVVPDRSGSVAARAARAVNDLNDVRRWVVHSEDSPTRF